MASDSKTGIAQSGQTRDANIRVTTMDAEILFASSPSATGKMLFDHIVVTTGVTEPWYFGLQYEDSKGDILWLKMEKKISSVDIKKQYPLQLQFRIVHYPLDISRERNPIQHNTLKLFYLQIKYAITSGEIYCPPETAALLTSLAEQNAMLDYLRTAQDLKMYGVHYFPIKDKKGSDIWLGVGRGGINIYERGDKQKPETSYPWQDIRNLSFNDRKLIIKPMDKKLKDGMWFTTRHRMSKGIMALGMACHKFYMTQLHPEQCRFTSINPNDFGAEFGHGARKEIGFEYWDSKKE